MVRSKGTLICFWFAIDIFGFYGSRSLQKNVESLLFFAPRSFALRSCNQRAQTSQNKGQLPRLWCWSTPRAPHRRSEAFDTPAGVLGTTLCTYQVGLKQPPPRRIEPWAMHIEGKWLPKQRPITPHLVQDRRPLPLAECPRHQTHLSGPWEPLCTRTGSV